MTDIHTISRLHDAQARVTGGSPSTRAIPLVRPSVPDAEDLGRDLQRILDSRILTNGPFVREFEEQAASYLGVRHCIAVSSCTAGLMLILRGSNLSGDVVCPSFTFAATAHAIEWNGLRPKFADIDPRTLTISPESLRRAIGVRTSAILATHIFGTPCDVEALTAIAQRHGLKLFFDAAHAFGSRHKGRSVGAYGDAEVFSLSPTKVLVAGEGGIVATDNDEIAYACRIGRDYGNPGDYNCRFVGLNARMSEFHAAVALRSLEGLDERIDRRNWLADTYREALGQIDGISFPEVPEADRSTYKDFTILVDADTYGLSAEELGSRLAQCGIETRRYYAPPLHQMEAYRLVSSSKLPLTATDAVVDRVLTLPLWSDMVEQSVVGVAATVASIGREAAGALRQAL